MADGRGGKKLIIYVIKGFAGIHIYICDDHGHVDVPYCYDIICDVHTLVFLFYKYYFYLFIRFCFLFRQAVVLDISVYSDLLVSRK